MAGVVGRFKRTHYPTITELSEQQIQGTCPDFCERTEHDNLDTAESPFIIHTTQDHDVHGVLISIGTVTDGGGIELEDSGARQPHALREAGRAWPGLLTNERRGPDRRRRAALLKARTHIWGGRLGLADSLEDRLADVSLLLQSQD